MTCCLLAEHAYQIHLAFLASYIVDLDEETQPPSPFHQRGSIAAFQQHENHYHRGAVPVNRGSAGLFSDQKAEKK